MYIIKLKFSERVKCKGTVDWVCPESHRFSGVNVCQLGFPQQCPYCEAKKLERHRDILRLGHHELSEPFPVELSLFKCKKLKISTEEFFELQALVLQRFSEVLESKKLSLTSMNFVPREFQCFNILKDDKVTKHLLKILKRKEVLTNLSFAASY
jgi:hypothetical protein